MNTMSTTYKVKGDNHNTIVIDLKMFLTRIVSLEIHCSKQLQMVTATSIVSF